MAISPNDPGPISRVMLSTSPATAAAGLKGPSTQPDLPPLALRPVTALLTREFRGGRAAQLLACAATAVAPLIATMHGLGTAGFDLLVSVLLCWLTIRILRTGEPRLWLVAGLAAGAGLLDTDLVALPRLAGRPRLAGTGGRPLDRGRGQRVLGSVVGYPARPAGPGAGLVRPGLDHRAGAAAAGPRAAPLPGRYAPVLLAAGAVPVVGWVGRGRPGLRRGLLATGLVLSAATLAVSLPVLPVTALRHSPFPVGYDTGATIGWPAYVQEIARVYHSLPAAQQASAAILTSNYAEAGAVDRFGSADGLPAAYSPETGFWYWGPPPPSTTTSASAPPSRASRSGSAPS